MQNFDIERYISGISTLPFSVVNTFEDPDDQLDTFNTFPLSAVNENATL